MILAQNGIWSREPTILKVERTLERVSYKETYSGLATYRALSLDTLVNGIFLAIRTVDNISKSKSQSRSFYETPKNTFVLYKARINK